MHDAALDVSRHLWPGRPAAGRELPDWGRSPIAGGRVHVAASSQSRVGMTDALLRMVRHRPMTIGQLAAALGMDTRDGRARVSSAMNKLLRRKRVHRYRGGLAGLRGSYWWGAH